MEFDEYDIGGSLNSLAAGWGGDSNGWNNITFDFLFTQVKM